jgi:UDP-N-acetylglucosamine 3-dehydrogenase
MAKLSNQGRLVEMIGVAIIGAGYWGTKLIAEYIALSKKRRDVKLIAIADASPKRLLQISKEFSLPNSMVKKSYKEILENREVTGVHIATPNETHYEIANNAILAGKHVLLEKPMCLRSHDAFRLARNAEKSNLVLLIGHIFRFNNAVNKVKELIEREEICKIRYVELRWTAFLPHPSSTDIIFDLAPHPIDIMNHLLEEWPTQVYTSARSYVRKRIGLEEAAFATMEFPNDITASMVLSWIYHGPKQRIVTIVSEKNTLEMEVVEQRIMLYENNQAREIPIERNNTINSEINHFVRCVTNNDPPINSALTGALNVSVLESMRKSLQEGNVASVVGG